MPPRLPLIYAHDPFLAIHGALQARWLDGPMLALSIACEGWAIAVIGLVLFGVAERNFRRVVVCFLPLGFGLLASGALVRQLKEISYLPRPLLVFGPGLVHVLGESLYVGGLPSGHATVAALLAGLCSVTSMRRPPVVKVFLSVLSLDLPSFHSHSGPRTRCMLGSVSPQRSAAIYSTSSGLVARLKERIAVAPDTGAVQGSSITLLSIRYCHRMSMSGGHLGSVADGLIVFS